ncbi:MAG: hypothetical protein JSU94_03525 [Phycisphaerales bacterium]|nr:MAG: hypothetical protein JSU94_03525 [Phycisphaerales bacterium]
MSEKLKCALVFWALLGLVLAAPGPAAHANWSDTFNNNSFDLPTWQFYCYPDITKTFTQTIKDGPDDNDYLSFDETSTVAIGGSAFGTAFGANENFTDVRVGAIVNVTGDASYRHHGLAARVSYLIDDGTISGYPGIIASCYVMHINWEVGPANLMIDIEKVVNLQNMMDEDFDTPASGLIHDRSYYAELDVIGTDPTYVTGSLYEYKGGPVVARTPIMIDTGGRDWWEDEGVRDAPFLNGVSGIFAQNEQEDPVGYHTTFDDVFSVSDGPAAVTPSPADGAKTVRTVGTVLSWKEAAFATSRQLWFGKAGAMEQVTPSPAGSTYSLPDLEYGATYQWRIDQVGPSGPVAGRLWTFTTAECLTVDDIEDYVDPEPDTVWNTWIDGWEDANNGSFTGYPDPNFPAGEHWVEAEIVHGGAQSMPVFYDNTGTVNYSEVVAQTSKLPIGSDWTQGGGKALGLYFYGDRDNTEATMYVRLEDGAAKTHTVTHPAAYAVQSEAWWQWNIDLQEFVDAGLDLSNVTKVCIGLGDTTNTVTCDGKGMVLFDDIGLCPARCFNKAGLDLRGDVNADCKVNFGDFAVMADGWLNDGLSVLP